MSAGLRLRTAAILAAVVLLAQGCAAVPPGIAQGADPADPTARVASTQYRPVLGGYTSERPVEPAPWTGRKDGAPPVPKDGR
ncbi:MAG TPA: hypothetical protein VG986_03990 [Pseudolabrys sp.]|nr:hypothetical protein [Pseudolabrys sp.]